MKQSLLMISVLLMAGSAFADQDLYGYLNEDRNGAPYFVSVDPRKDELTAALPLRFFNENQVAAMSKCMAKRETHMIVVRQTSATQNGVPSGIPGRTVTTHFPRYENIRCVAAKGFIFTWRSIVSRSNFR